MLFFRQGHLDTVVALMKAGADPSLRDYAGFSCIHRAAQFAYTHIVAYIVAKGTDTNFLDSCSMTPLMWSAFKVNRYTQKKNAQKSHKRLLLAFYIFTSI